MKIWYSMICGIDEAGRGPVIGPMVVAGVAVRDDDELVEMEVKDSKKLSVDKREELEEKIKDVSTYAYRVIPAEEIDVLRDDITLNQIEVGLFSSIIDEICDPTTVVYVDSACTDEEAFSQMIQTELSDEMDIVSRHGADDIYPVVSAASILAKVKRDQEVERIAEELEQDIGSGYPSDVRTRSFLKRWVDEHGELPPYTRKSWETAREILNLARTKRLDEF